MHLALALLAALALTECAPEPSECRCAPEAAAQQAAWSPDCSSCKWALDVCLSGAIAETRRELGAGECDILICLARHRDRRAACDQSYAACVTDCR